MKNHDNHVQRPENANQQNHATCSQLDFTKLKKDSTQWASYLPTSNQNSSSPCSLQVPCLNPSWRPPCHLQPTSGRPPTPFATERSLHGNSRTPGLVLQAFLIILHWFCQRRPVVMTADVFMVVICFQLFSYVFNCFHMFSIVFICFHVF